MLYLNILKSNKWINQSISDYFNSIFLHQSLYLNIPFDLTLNLNMSIIQYYVKKTNYELNHGLKHLLAYRQIKW